MSTRRQFTLSERAKRESKRSSLSGFESSPLTRSKRRRVRRDEEGENPIFETPEILMNVLLALTSFEDVFNACDTNRTFRQVCSSSYFWMEWLKRHIHDLSLKTYADLILNAEYTAYPRTLTRSLTSNLFLNYLASQALVFESPTTIEALLERNLEELELALFGRDKDTGLKVVISPDQRVLVQTVADLPWQITLDTTEFWREWSKRGLLSKKSKDLESVWSALNLFDTYPLAKPFENQELYQRYYIDKYYFTDKPTRFSSWGALLKHINLTEREEELRNGVLRYFPYDDRTIVFAIDHFQIVTNARMVVDLLENVDNTPDNTRIINAFSSTEMTAGYFVHPFGEYMDRFLDEMGNVLNNIIGVAGWE